MATRRPTIRFSSFPPTEPPPVFAAELSAVFAKREPECGTSALEKGLTSNQVLTLLRDDLMALGFQVEASKQKNDKIQRPVAVPSL
jgi:hypothetical protein